jgi:hypothetical protein
VEESRQAQTRIDSDAVRATKKIPSRTALLAGIMAGLSIGAGPAFSQPVKVAATSPETTFAFHCPTSPVAVHLSNGATVTWGIRDGAACRRDLRLPTGEITHQLWYAPTFTTNATASGAFAEQGKPWTLWPLSVGKTIHGRYDGAAADPGFTGSWLYTTTVNEHKKYTTKAGTFDVLVVTREEEALGGTFKSKLREWYVPELGVSIQTAYSDNTGVSSLQEAISIRR